MSIINAKAYAKPCGCGAQAGQECPHTPTRCEHEFEYEGPLKIRRMCRICGMRQEGEYAWTVTRAAYGSYETASAP